MKDLYQDFAKDYDEFGEISDYLGAEESFFEKLFSENQVKSVLDCACGTGQHLYLLNNLGFQVMGSDNSPAMLDVANKNLASLKTKIPLRQADFRYLEKAFDETFDSIVCLTTALPHLHHDEDLLTALKSIYQRLNSGGLLVLTQGLTDFTLTLPPIEVVVNRPDFSRIFVKSYDEEFQKIQVLDLYHSPERLEENQYDIIYKIILADDYRRLLSQAGYSEIEIYGDYQRTPYTKNSQRMIVVARRKD